MAAGHEILALIYNLAANHRNSSMGTASKTAGNGGAHIHAHRTGIASWPTSGGGAFNLPRNHFRAWSFQPAQARPALNSRHPARAYEISTHNYLDHDRLVGGALKHA